jgi:molybdate transport system substrate-binding protein
VTVSQADAWQGERAVTQIDIQVLSTTAMKTVFDELAPQFERATGNRLSVSLGPSLQLEKRLGDGEAADMAIVSAAGARDLIAAGKLVAGSLIGIAHSALGVAVRKGAPKPDISSADAFRRALLAAKSVAMSKPVGGGQSGVHMAKVLDRLGIAEALAAKSKYGGGGPSGLVGLIVQRGEADLGIQQIAELMAVDGIDMVGPLPADLQSVTPFVAGIPTNANHADAGRALIDFLTTPAAKRVIKSKGLDPA